MRRHRLLKELRSLRREDRRRRDETADWSKRLASEGSENLNYLVARRLEIFFQLCRQFKVSMRTKKNKKR